MKLPRNINHYHSKSSLLFQFILSEYFKVSAELGKNRDFEKVLHTISGSALASMRLFSWTLDDSPVAKLKIYCAYLNQETELPKKERDEVRRLSFELWEEGLQSLNLLEQKKNPSKLMKSMEEKSTQFAEGLKAILKRFISDENVLYFILRHHKQFDAIFGDKAASKILQKSKDILIDGYKKRKFDSLLPKLEELLVKI